jgi:hypothetical protein
MSIHGLLTQERKGEVELAAHMLKDVPEIRIPSGAASAWSRAAMLTPSP